MTSYAQFMNKLSTGYPQKLTELKGDGIKCGKNEKLREVFFMLSEHIKERLIKLHIELNNAKDEEKSSFLLSKATTEIFNLVNCREKEFYDKIDNENKLKIDE